MMHDRKETSKYAGETHLIFVLMKNVQLFSTINGLCWYKKHERNEILTK